MADLGRRAFEQLSARLGRGGAPLQAALRWVEWSGGDAPLRLGFDPSTPGLPRRLPARWTGGTASVALHWVSSAGVARAQGWLRPENLAHSVGPGTLSAVLRSRGPQPALYALTAGHVLAGDPAARFGDAASLSTHDQTVEGRLYNWSPDLGARDRAVGFDAALMSVTPQALEALVDDIAWPAGWADVDTGAAVRLLTRQHRLAAQVVGRISTAIEVGDPPQRYVLEDVLCYQVDAGSMPGDSGAPLWDTKDRLVAMHVGQSPPGSSGNAVASPIGRALAWSGCEPVLRNQDLLGDGRDVVTATAAPAQVNLPGPAVGSAPAQVQAIDVLARTLWGEARGEPDAEAGMRAVAHVVLNRCTPQRWWGHAVAEVCLFPWQFSCWNANDPNRPKLQAVQRSNALFDLAQRIAEELLLMPEALRRHDDQTQGATHYHARSLAPPPWTRSATFTGRIGNHLFYRNVA